MQPERFVAFYRGETQTKAWLAGSVLLVNDMHTCYCGLEVATSRSESTLAPPHGERYKKATFWPRVQ